MAKFIRTSESITKVIKIDTQAALKLQRIQSSGRNDSYKSDEFAQFGDESPTIGPKAHDALPKVKWPY